MKPYKIMLAVGCALAFHAAALATVWTGTITQTVTFSTNPTYQIGDTFLGSYQIVSDVLDGDYGLNYYTMDHPGAKGGLSATVFLLDWGYQSIYYQQHFAVFTHLSVANAMVSEFYLENQIAATGYLFYNSAFSFTNSVSAATHVRGTTAFSAPIAVPDAGDTVKLLCLGLLTLFAVQKFATPRRSLTTD